MLGPLVIVSTAVALAVGSATLVAMSAIEFGDGALPGALYSPEELTDPHVAAVQAAPSPVIESVQVTAVFVVPVTLAVN
jgi:hypothetical protein